MTADQGGPPAPGHRRLRDILSDVARANPEPGPEITALHAEFMAAAEALFDLQATAAARRRGPAPICYTAAEDPGPPLAGLGPGDYLPPGKEWGQ